MKCRIRFYSCVLGTSVLLIAAWWKAVPELFYSDTPENLWPGSMWIVRLWVAWLLTWVAYDVFAVRRKKVVKEDVTVTQEDVTLLAFLEEHKLSLEYFQDEYGASLAWEVTDGNDATWYPHVVGRGATVKAAIEDAIKYVERKKVGAV